MINSWKSVETAGYVSLNRLLTITLLVYVACISVAFGQGPVVSIPTSRSNNQRTGANVNETILTPSNVNKNQFGALFSYPMDYLALAQPLYVPNVNINVNGQVTTHNVVYVATMADSVYAFDADTGVGLNGNPYLWWVNFTNPAIYGPGISTASLETNTLPCAGGKTTGFTQEGIAATPTIDTATNTMYVVAKTLENGTVRHRLHALDITTGEEKFGGPTIINATSTSNKGHVWTFNSLHQLNRPGLLLTGGVIYMGFGSNSCNDVSAGWVLAYDADTLQQVGSFNSSPDIGLTSIWQTGNGLASDGQGRVYAVTAESTNYDVPNGGQSYSHSVLEFTPNSSLANTLVLSDYFTPDDVAYLNTHDLDLSSGGAVVLPDQDGPASHLLVAAGKTGRLYVLNRDEMGTYTSNDGQLSPLPGGTGGEEIDGDFGKLGGITGPLFDSPAYWNGMLYYAGDGDEIKAFGLTNTYPPVTTTPIMTTTQKYVGSHSPSISANGNNNGILWVMSGTIFYAFNASNLAQQLYNSTQVASRDQMPAIAHFATQIVANGKVYIAGQTVMQAYGLLPSLNLVGGGNQSGPILTTLPQPIQIQVVDPYSGAGVAGVTVSFSDGGKKGTFNPPTAVSDSNGNLSTSYTFSKTAGVYTITASSPKSTTLSFSETALPGPPTKIITYSGNKQTGQAGSILPTPLRAQVQDSHGNGVPGITVTFTDPTGLGTFNPSSIATNSSGLAVVTYQLPNVDGTYTLYATAQGITKKTQFIEYATGAGPESIAVVSGNNQSAPVNTTLPLPLVVQVNDQGGNPISGVSVVFSAPSGSFTGSPATTNSSGAASVSYTTGLSPGAVTVTAAVNSLNTQIAVNASAGAPATATPSGGNNQTGAAGTTLPQALTVFVADQYGNPVPGVLVNYSDGGVGGTFANPNPATTDNTGTATQSYTLPPTAGAITINAAAAGIANPAVFSESAVSGPAANINISNGNNQFAPAGMQLPQSLSVVVTDQYGNPVAGVNVNFDDGGAGGTFSNPNPVTTDNTGTATQIYTLPPTPGTIYINAAATGVANPAIFTETGQ